MDSQLLPLSLRDQGLEELPDRAPPLRRVDHHLTQKNQNLQNLRGVLWFPTVKKEKDTAHFGAKVAL